MWTYDFLEDRCQHGGLLRILTVMDAFTREGLAIEVARSMPAATVLAILAQLVATYGAPAFLRSDNGPKFVAVAVQLWLAGRQIQTLYIDPGCPWQNRFGESFNGTVRDECLNLEVCASVAEARVRLTAFRHLYHDEQPHSSLGYQTPTEFKHAWVAAQTGTAGL